LAALIFPPAVPAVVVVEEVNACEAGWLLLGAAAAAAAVLGDLDASEFVRVVVVEVGEAALTTPD
jgi:hypothetical protein